MIERFKTETQYSRAPRNFNTWSVFSVHCVVAHVKKPSPPSVRWESFWKKKMKKMKEKKKMKKMKKMKKQTGPPVKKAEEAGGGGRCSGWWG